MLLRQIECFVSVAQTGSFSAAADRLHISQPSLGAHIRQLEQRYGLSLFTRHARGARLTAAGSKLLDKARLLLAAAEQTENALRSMGRASRVATVRLGVTPTAEATLAPDLLELCARGNGRISLTLVEGRSEDLRRLTEVGELDAALCYGGLSHERVEGHWPLFSEDLFLVGPAKSFGARRTISFEELVDVPLTLDRRSQAIRRLVDEVAEEKNVKLTVRHETEPVDVKRVLIRRHGHFSIVPFGLFSDEIAQGTMSALRIVKPPLRRSMYLVCRKGLPTHVSAYLLKGLGRIVAAAIETGQFRWSPVKSRAPS